ncbi:MAG TPA: condensation domain-containing protein [Acidobacteriota bacterium]|nr:condensation domain-containing protein [Acidobacteriota bacterium]
MIEQFLAELRQRQVRIWAEGDRLRYQAPPGALDESCRRRLRKHREQLLERLGSALRSLPQAVPRADRSHTLPLSSGQQRMWAQWKLAPLSPAYNIAFTLKLEGPLRVSSMVGALSRVRRRQEVLQTYFVETPDGPMQVVDRAPCNLPAEEVADEAAAWRLMSEDASKPFNLAQRAPFQARLFRQNDQLHWLFVKLHHIVADVSSVSIFLRELAAFYQAPEASLPEPALSYADFAVWEQGHLKGARKEKLLAYWRQKLSGQWTPVRLPFAAFCAPPEEVRGERVSFHISKQLGAGLAEVGRSLQATRFMLLVSAFRILLLRYTELTDVLIGTPVIRRTLPGTEALMGYFGNTIVLRNPLRPSDTWQDVLAGERAAALEAFEHQDLPIETLAEELARQNPPRSGPLFQVMLSFTEASSQGYEFRGLRADLREVETQTAKFDLLLSLQESEAGLNGIFEYPHHLFDRRAVRRMAGHFELVLTEMARNPHGCITTAPLLTPPERDLMLWRWRDAESTQDIETSCLHELFEARVRERPEAVAVRFGQEVISYSRLNDEANRLAGRLLDRSVRPGQVVALCMRRTPRLIASLLGVLKAGAAFICIEPHYPLLKIQALLDQCCTQVLVAEGEVAESLPRWEGEVLLPDEGDAPPLDRGLPAAPESLACIMLSGRDYLGIPKMVMIEHRSVTSLLDWAHGFYPAEDLAAVLASCSLCRGPSLFEIFVPLCSGHSLVLAENALSLPFLPARDSVTMANTTPGSVRVLLRKHPEALPESLRVVNLYGERLETALADQVCQQAAGSLRVYDLYGLVEAGAFAACKLRRPGQAPAIGRPISNTRCYVLDQRGLPVPAGVVGELYLAGAGLARGYLHRPRQTAETFTPPPHGDIPDKRLCRTGDRVRCLENGDLQFWGRDDEVLEDDGMLIDGAQVRAALLHCQGIDDAWIVRDKDSGAGLRAFVTASYEGLDLKSVRRLLAVLLPQSKPLLTIGRIADTPLTAQGKVDVSGLQTTDSRGIAAADRSPRTETERRLCEIWKQLLSLERLSVHDHFFDLGGHSLIGIRVMARINEDLGVALPLQAILKHPTVSELAAEVDRSRGLAKRLPPLRARSAAASPTTLVQRHFWSVDRTAENPHFLNIASSFALRGPFDLAAGKQALEALSRRHPILGAKFDLRDGRLWQQWDDGTCVEAALFDFAHIRDEQEKRLLLEAAQSEAARPFDLARGPCARFMIARLQQDHHVLTLVAHHIVADEWSLGVLGREFAADYEAIARGLDSPLTRPSLTFGDYAFWERECLEQGLFDGQVAQWKSILEPPLERMRFSWRPARDGSEEGVESYPLKIAPALSMKLAKVARREQTSLFVVLLSALKRLLQRQGGSCDVRVATNLASRHQRPLENMVGPLTDTLVLRTRVSPRQSPLGALRRVRESFLHACGHHDVPFEELMRRLSTESGIERSALAQAFFLFDEQPAEMNAFAGLTTEPAPVEAQSGFFKSAVHDYDLILYLAMSDSGLSGQLTLKGRLGSGTAAGALLGRYNALLEEIVEHAFAR